MPGKTHISEETGLSRQTIHKHLKEFDTHPCYLEEIRKFKFMSDRVLSKVFKLAIAGDTKAARLYFEMIGKLSQNEKDSKTLNTQNNFIQINQIKVDQETIKQLDSEQIRQAELLFKAFIKKDKVHDN